MFQIHPDREVQQALIRLNDALCTWERSTGLNSVLILREDNGFVFRSMSGKPLDESKQVGIEDAVLMGSLRP